MTESSNQEPIVNLLQEEKYNSIDILRLIQFCESNVGEKISKDIDNWLKLTTEILHNYSESISYKNMQQTYDYIVRSREARRIVQIIKGQLFDLKRLNEKYNHLVAEERSIAEQQLAESEFDPLAVEQD